MFKEEMMEDKLRLGIGQYWRFGALILKSKSVSVKRFKHTHFVAV